MAKTSSSGHITAIASAYYFIPATSILLTTLLYLFLFHNRLSNITANNSSTALYYHVNAAVAASSYSYKTMNSSLKKAISSSSSSSPSPAAPVALTLDDYTGQPPVAQPPWVHRAEDDGTGDRVNAATLQEKEKQKKVDKKLEKIERQLARARAAIKEAAERRNYTTSSSSGEKKTSLNFVPSGPIYRNPFAFHQLSFFYLN